MTPVLCYVDGNEAWFTTAPLDKQWGDDWNDAPYEYNAGPPYEWREGYDGEPYQLSRVFWADANLDQPKDGHLNSPYSVERINAGAVPWLVTSRWHTGPVVAIPAGATVEEFKTAIRSAGGTVFVEEPSRIALERAARRG